jgi:C-terminal processing protease CtpA/Prc
VYIVRQSSNDNTSGRSRVGIGISFGITRTGEIFITGLSPKGPAKASGKIKEGDQLLAVDGVDIKEWQVADIVQLILGKPGSKLRLDIVPAQVDMQGNFASAAPEIKQTEHKQPTTSRPSQQPPPEQKQPTMSKPSFNPPPPDLNSNDHEVTNLS